MYHAVPGSPGPPEVGVRVVVVLDVPGDVEDVARTIALADDFATGLSRLIPGLRPHPTVATALSPPHFRGTTAVTPAGVTIDLIDRRVTVDGRPVRLAYQEFELLAQLAAVPHRTVSRTVLLSAGWANHDVRERLSERTVDTHVSRLRVKLGPHAHIVTTVRGHGYRFDPGTDVRVRVGRLRDVAL